MPGCSSFQRCMCNIEKNKATTEKYIYNNSVPVCRKNIPKDDSETCNHNFNPPRRGWLSRFGTPRGIISMETCKTLHSWRILYAPGSISVHGGVSQGEPRTQTLRKGAKLSSALPTGGKISLLNTNDGIILLVSPTLVA